VGANASRPVSADLAQFAAQLDFEKLPDAVIDRVALMVLDSLGIAHFVAARTEWGRLMVSHASDVPGPCCVLGSDISSIPSLAALANGTLTMGFEYEDMHDRGTGHPFSIVFPAVLAAAQAAGCSGAEFITSLVAGYEVAVRSSFGMSEGSQAPWTERGVYPITIFGVLGAAVGAGKAMGLGQEAILHALGIAGSHAFGTMEAHKEGSMTRRLHAGRAAEIGVTAAMLAARGFDGPRQIIEGEFGIYRAYTGEIPDLATVTGDLGSDWQTAGVWLKNYPCNGLFQAPIDGLLSIMAYEGLSEDQVEMVKVSIARATPLHERPSAITPVNAQFSLHYCMAVSLVRGRPKAEMFLQSHIGDPEVVAAMNRIQVELDPGLNTRFPGSSRPGRVEVVTVDGASFYSEIAYPKGHPKNPMGWDEVHEKYIDLMRDTTDLESALALEKKVKSLHELAVVPDLSAN
jgi:2-methylcitrate dehydratase PrpD